MAMRLPVLALAFALLTPLLAGCLGGDEASAPTSIAAAGSAEEAGARSGETPAAPRDAYTVEDAENGSRAVVHPVPVMTNPARPPVELDFSGEFAPNDCRPLQFGGMEAQLTAASHARRFWDLAEHLQVGDVFAYEIRLTYANSESNWGEIHPFYGLGSSIASHEEPTQDATDVEVVWTGQGYRASEDDPAYVALGCYFGIMTQPIPYTYTVRFTFAEGAVPAESPMRLTVPEGASRLFVTGVPVDPSKGVLSHFRLFGPDDKLVCECALSSNQPATTVDLVGPGDYVLLVDHTDNGFVSAGLDVAPDAPMQALPTEWVEVMVLSADGGAVDQTVELDFPRVPLFMHAWVFARDASPTAGAGQGTRLHVTNDRGEVMRYAWGGHLTFEDPAGEGTAWLGIPTVTPSAEGAPWEAWTDHHAYSPGTHTAHVKADALRGDVWILYRQYVR